MKEVIKNIGLNPDKWMPGEHCLNGDWIIEWMIIGGDLTFILYFSFSIMCLLAIRNEVALKIHSKRFWRSLFMVFLNCSLIHLGHTWGKIEPYFYLICLLYPFLVYNMFSVLIETFRDLRKWNKIKTESNLNDIHQILSSRFEKLKISDRAKRQIKNELNKNLK